MIKSTHVICSCLLLAFIACQVTHAATPPTETYTQLNVSMPALNLPSDENNKRRVFNSIIKSLGFGNKTRKISVSIKVKIGQIELPEQSLLSYGFNFGSNILETDINKNGISFPLKKLGANEKIFVALVYRDVTSAQYNTGEIASMFTRLMPGSSLINEANAPLIGSVFELSNATWNAMASETGSNTEREELSPYISGEETATLTIKNRDGELFCTVNLSLHSTFSMLQPAVIIKNFDLQGMKRGSNEMHTNLINEVAGVRQSFATTLRSEPSYTQLIRAASSDSVKQFCDAAREFLINKNGLTVTDSTYVTHGVLSDAGFWKNRNRSEYFHDCFIPAEITTLYEQNDISPPEVMVDRLEPTVKINAMQHLYAFGCWMTSMSGPSCATNASDPNGILMSILGDNVRVDVDSAFLSTNTLGVRDTMSKASVIELLNNTASSFSCFQQGMLVKSKDSRIFRFEGELSDGKIITIKINPTSDAALLCTD